MKAATIRTKTAALLTMGVLALSTGFLLLDKQEFSEHENRYLEKFPEISWERIESGEYMKDLNSYLCDHFPLRDFFIGMKSKAEIAVGKREINQVFIAGDGYLIENYKKPENTEQIAGIFKEKPVVLRTLDIGGDKQVPYMELPKEDNPFLGIRGLRLCLNREDIFRTQLRAALRASAYGNLMIMFPMVTSINEFYAAKKIVKDIEKELDEQEIAYDHNIKVGIMIEVPSVALIADQIIDEIDFASVGTNDLCQYLCAADRMNHAVKDYYQDYHPAVFRVLRDLASVFEASGKCLSICGELAGDPLAIPLLAGIGIRTLSMNETSIARAKRVICNMRMEEAKALAEEALDRKSNWEIEKLLREFQEKNRE